MKVLLLLLLPFGLSAQTYYFATAGSDAGAGTSASPYKTITKANTLTGDTFLFKGGDTFYGQLIPKSGTLGNPVVFSSYGTGKATITGFSDISGWTQSGNIWLSSTQTVTSMNIITIGGAFVPIGKYPNGAKVYIPATVGSISTVGSTAMAGTWTGGTVVMRKNHWIIDKAVITSQTGTTLSFTNPNTSYPAQIGWGFFIQNKKEACDIQNEWYYASSKLGIFSTPLAPSNVKAATIDTLVKITSNNYVTFWNLQFTGSNMVTALITSGHHITFRSCDFAFAGINGITASSSAHHITVDSCTSNWTNNNFISGGGSIDWVVTNNYFQNTATVPGMGSSSDGNYIGIYNVGDSSIVQRNRVTNSGYSGIDFRGSAIQVKDNVVDGFCQVKDDGAGIYTYAGGVHTYGWRIVSGNTVKNGGGASAGTNTTNSDAFGIYLDNNSSEVLVTNNYVQDCGSSGIFLHGNHNVIIRSNIIYNAVQSGGYGQLLVVTDGSFGSMRNVTVTRNQFTSKASSQVAGYYKTTLGDYSSWGTFDSNFYSGNRFSIAGTQTSLAGWQTQSAMEAHSTTGSPTVTPPNPTTFLNQTFAQTMSTTCVSGSKISATYTVPMGKYSSTVSQADANSKALAEITAWWSNLLTHCGCAQ
jgi:hypothetical protein